MAEMLSPGIYLYEADYSEYVSSSSTCIVGCVGEAKRGPIGVPTLVTSQKDLLNIFGTPTEGEYGIYSALQILSQAQQLYYVRVVRSATKATAGKVGVDKVIYKSLTAGTEGNGLKIKQKKNNNGTFDITVYRDTETSTVPGSEAVYRYDVVTVTADTYASLLETGLYCIQDSSGDYVQVSADAAFDADKVYYSRSVVTPATEETTVTDPIELEEFTGLTLNDGDANFVETVLTAQSRYIRAEVYETGSVETKDLELSGAVGTGAYAYAGDPTTDKLVFRSKYFDSTLNAGKVTISDPDNFGYFNVYITDADGNSVESFPSVTIDKGDDRYVGSVINKTSNRIVVEVNEDPEIYVEGDELTFLGGDDGVRGISDADIIGEENGTGIQSMSNPELLSVDVIVVPGKTNPTVINAALKMCEDRGDCMLVADTPFGLTPQQVVDWSNGDGAFNDHTAFNSSYGAFYWPWIQVADSYSKKNIWLPPSGYIVAKYAYNDKVAYPWVAPAGTTRGRIQGVLGIEKSPTKGERDMLYGNRNIINPIANFQAEGLVIWGQKTMQRKPTALDRVNVRRLLGYLKRVVGNATRNFVFEQNNSSTWTEWKTLVNPILNNVESAGGLYEYKIYINPTAEDIENNRMPVFIYVKPTKSAEFIPITFNVMPYSASFNGSEI